MPSWSTIPEQSIIETTIAALKANGIEALVVETGAEAKEKALEFVPKGAEVMTMTSVTADTIGLTKELNESGSFRAVRDKLYALDPKTQKREQKRLGAAPEYTVGSVHAVTQDGEVMVASNTGSQLPAYAYGSDHVIWVVGAQKIVKDLDSGFQRIKEHTLPLESERARKAYGADGSNISKMLIFNKEITPGRLTLIFIKENIGF